MGSVYGGNCGFQVQGMQKNRDVCETMDCILVNGTGGQGFEHLDFAEGM